MSVDHGCGCGPIVIEIGGAHRRLDLLDLRLALGDPRFQVGNPLAQGLERPLLLAPARRRAAYALRVTRGLREPSGLDRGPKIPAL